MSNAIKGPFIVTGASGQLGSQVIENLLAQGGEPLVAITRTPEKLAALRARGVDVRAGDFNAPTTLGKAFAGGGRLLIISTDDLEPGKRLAAHRNAIARAALLLLLGLLLLLPVRLPSWLRVACRPAPQAGWRHREGGPGEGQPTNRK